MQHWMQFVTGGTLWTPAEITTLGWWDPSDADSITSSMGDVSQLDDLSGGTAHLKQTVGADQPETGARTLGGLNLLDCDGTEYMEDVNSTIPSSGDIGIHIVAVIDVIDAVNDCIISTNFTNDYAFRAFNSSTFNGEIVGTGIGANIALTSTPHNGPSVYNLNFDFAGAGKYNAFVDGTQRAVDTTYSTKLDSNQSLRIFANSGGSIRPDGAFGEIVFTEDVTQATRERITGYLAWKWDGGVAGTLVGNLPIGHPYKSTPPKV